jgi:hypothetical protein
MQRAEIEVHEDPVGTPIPRHPWKIESRDAPREEDGSCYRFLPRSEFVSRRRTRGRRSGGFPNPPATTRFAARSTSPLLSESSVPQGLGVREEKDDFSCDGACDHPRIPSQGLSGNRGSQWNCLPGRCGRKILISGHLRLHGPVGPGRRSFRGPDVARKENYIKGYVPGVRSHDAQPCPPWFRFDAGGAVLAAGSGEFSLRRYDGLANGMPFPVT